LRVVGTGLVYRRLVGARRVSNAHADADACVTSSVAVAASHDAGGCGAVCGLAGIGENAALAVAGVVDVLVAGLWVCFHGDDRQLESDDGDV
jgi:hypothetical protein